LKPTTPPPAATNQSAITLRLMAERDLPMLHAWLNRPHVLEWWARETERRTFDEVRQHYLPSAMALEGVTPYIALSDGEPIGYAQSYVVFGRNDGWWQDETDPGVRGIDQFLANPSQLNQGHGTRLVHALVDALFVDATVSKIQTDPHPSNQRAIRCYEKAGFVRVRSIITPDGPAVYMIRSRRV
jgi:AacA4 family aminoglycoside N(6')-acetyltransferase